MSSVGPNPGMEPFIPVKDNIFFHYYDSWGGWDDRADPWTRELYRMKNLSSIPMWIGSSVHDHIEWIINCLFRWKEPVSMDKAKERLRKFMKSDWYASSIGYYKKEPKQLYGLVEHYYDEQIDEIDFEKAYADAEHSIDNFYRKSIYSKISNDPSVELEFVEELDEIYIEDIKVWVVCDLVLHWDNLYQIIDWKTGKRIDSEDHHLQLATYAIYLAQKLNINFQDIRVHLSFLYPGKENISLVTQNLIDDASTEIITSATQMKEMLGDPSRNIAVKEDFPMTNKIYLCKRCNFRKACEYPS